MIFHVIFSYTRVAKYLLETAGKKRERHVKRRLREFMCEDCGKTYIKYVNLRDHIDSVHKERPPFSCDLCGYSNRRLVNLSNHMKSKHLQPAHICMICSQACVTKGVLKNHLLLHSFDKKFVCKICQKGFAQNAGLLIHLAQTHNQKSFPCGDCGRIFKSYHRLYQHRYQHEGTNASKAKKKFICKICGYNAFASTNLENHMVKHSKVRPPSKLLILCKTYFRLNHFLVIFVAQNLDGNARWPNTQRGSIRMVPKRIGRNPSRLSYAWAQTLNWESRV